MVSCVLQNSVQSCIVSSFLTLFVFLDLSSVSCIYTRCVSSCASPCYSPMVGWVMDGGNGGVVRGRGDLWCEERAIV